MENSRLENSDPKILKVLLLRIYKVFEKKGLENESTIKKGFDSYSINQSIYDVLNLIGLDSGVIDVDFIYQLYKDNYQSIKYKNLDYELIIPRIGEYEVIVDLSEKVWITTTYSLKVFSYSDDNALSSIKHQDENGDISIYDGDQIDREIDDSETIEHTWRGVNRID